MKKEVKLLLKRATDALVLSIEHFNRPWDRGRVETVLILLDHSFELLLKAAILHKGGKIWKKRENQTIGFDECVKNSVPLKIITDEQSLNLCIINSLRDTAQHHLIDISEQILYLQTLFGVSVFKEILKNIFEKDLAKELPKRVLPISTTPPMSLEALFEHEVEEIRKLLIPKSRKRLQAIAKLRGLAIFDKGLKGDSIQPNPNQLQSLANSIKEGKKWNDIFPNLASVEFVTEGSDYSLSLKITKKNGIPVHLVPEGTPGAPIIAVKRVNELDFYSMNLTTLSKHVGIGPNKVIALLQHFDMKKDAKYYKEFVIGKSIFKRYSIEALNKLKEELPKTSIADIWQQYKNSRKTLIKNAKNND